MRKLKVLIFVPLSFILFYLVSYHASANTNSNNNLSFNIENVSKHFVSGTTNKYTNVNVLGKNIRSNTKGYFRIYLKNSIRYNKLTKFHLTKNKMSKNVYARLYSTKGININTVAKATKYASSIITGKSAHNYIWGGTYDKKSKSYIVRPTNFKLQSEGFTGTGNIYSVHKNGIIYDYDF